ncbi:hypothetical protein U1Q18_051798 [Sarracenia purpurea var. burkii]
MPLAIDCMIREYVNKFSASQYHWLQEHFSKVFHFHRTLLNDVLNDFDDFVSDWDGTIDYVRTAKRMISCDGLSERHFKELDDFLSFCCPETPARREFKQRLLQSCFLGDDSILNCFHLKEARSMNEFIDDAYDTQDQADEFKNQLTSSGVTKRRLEEFIHSGKFSEVENFVSTFVSNDECCDAEKIFR